MHPLRHQKANNKMHPELVRLSTPLGLFRIYSYSGFLWVALIIVWIGIYAQLGLYGMSRIKRVLFGFGIIVISLVGARIFHIFTNLSVYGKNPWLIIALDAHGLSLFGSIILISYIGLLAARKTSFPLWKFSDDMVPFIGTSFAVARIGCFLNGCCFGIVSNLPWAVRFPLFSAAHLNQLANGQTNIMTSLPVHPTQLYEAIGAILSIFIARWIQKKRKTHGIGICVFVAFFSLVRLIVHYVRVFPESFLGISPLFPALYGAIFVYCILLIREKGFR